MEDKKPHLLKKAGSKLGRQSDRYSSLTLKEYLDNDQMSGETTTKCDEKSSLYTSIEKRSSIDGSLPNLSRSKLNLNSSTVIGDSENKVSEYSDSKYNIGSKFLNYLKNSQKKEAFPTINEAPYSRSSS